MRRAITWLLWPRGAFIPLAVALALAAEALLIWRLGIFERGYQIALGGVIWLALVPVVTFVATVHLTVVIRALARWFWDGQFLTTALVLCTVAAASVWGAWFLDPSRSDEAPPVMASGGLAVFADFPVEELTMTVHRSTVGLGDPDRQVIVETTLPIHRGQEVHVALVGSGAASFEKAAVITGVEARTTDTEITREVRPNDPVRNVHTLPVLNASNLLPTIDTGAIAVARNAPNAYKLEPTWFQPTTTSSVVVGANVADDYTADVENVTITWALLLSRPSVGPSAGDLGDVGCASDFDSVARAASNGELDSGLIDVPTTPDSNDSQWFVPQACNVTVTIGQVVDHPVYLNGVTKGGAGATLVQFSGRSSRDSSRLVGADSLTIASTSYYVPTLASSSANGVLSNFLVGVAGAVFIALGSLCIQRGRVRWQARKVYRGNR